MVLRPLQHRAAAPPGRAVAAPGRAAL